MLPEIIDLGPFSLKGYGLMIGLGALLGYSVVAREARRVGFHELESRLSSFFIAVVISAFLGGKLLFLLAHRDEAASTFRREGFIGIITTGFVFYGSLLAAIPTVLWLMRRLRLPFLRTLDLLMLGVPIVQGMGRLGCFLGGCCYGCRTDAPVGVVFRKVGSISDVAVHPVQLYEAAGELAIFLVLWFGPRVRSRFPGHTTFLYLLLYGILRLVTELFRGDGNPVVFGSPGAHVAGDPPGGLTQAQVISIALIAISSLVLWRGMRRHQRLAPSPS